MAESCSGWNCTAHENPLEDICREVQKMKREIGCPSPGWLDDYKRRLEDSAAGGEVKEAPTVRGDADTSPVGDGGGRV